MTKSCIARFLYDLLSEFSAQFTKAGKFLLQIGEHGKTDGSNDTKNVNQAAGLAVYAPTKELFVADGYGNRRVIVFDSETGAYKRHWGAYGKPPSDDKTPAYDPAQPPAQQFGRPVHCVRFSKDGLVYVCDRINDRVQMFKKDGTFVAEAFFEKNTRLNGSVSELVFSADRDQKFIYMADGVNNELRIIERASNEHSRASAGPGASPASSTSCTTSQWTSGATFTRLK